jgi:Ca2+-binding RTX toxin-like protein
MLNLHRLKLALVAATLAVAWTSAQAAHAAPTCTLGGSLLTISVTENHDDVTLQAYDSGSILVFAPGKVFDCGGTTKTTNVDAILIEDTSDDVSTPTGYDGATTVRIAEPANFAPGKTPESSGSSEIEFFVDMKGGADTLVSGGLKPQNIFIGNGGVNWNLDDDADIVGMPFAHVQLGGSPARDLLIARGGQGTGAPLSTAKSLQITADAGDDYMSGSDIAGGDVIVGGPGSDNIEGAGGPDTIEGGPDDDIIAGGSGTDTVRFDGSQGANVDLSLAGPQDTGHGQDLLIDVENVHGTPAADQLIGDAGPNEIDGGSGDDVFEGGGGADELRGGEGTDTVSYADAPAAVTISPSRCGPAMAPATP